MNRPINTLLLKLSLLEIRVKLLLVGIARPKVLKREKSLLEEWEAVDETLV